jgi:AcrR family transcriptional regulator
VSTPSTEERILAEASGLFIEQGLLAFSMRKLAERLGLTATAIYRHFDSKEALIVAVCSEGFRLFAQYLFRALEERDAVQRLNRTRLEYLRFAIDHSHFYRTMFMTSVASLGWEKMPQQNQQRAEATFHFLVDRVRECQQAGELRAGDARALATQVWAHGHGLVSLRLAGHLAELTDSAFEAFYVASCAEQLRGLRNE